MADLILCCGCNGAWQGYVRSKATNVRVQGREHVLNHNSVPAACFTHPEVSFVGLNEEQARKEAEDKGFKVRSL